MLRKLPVEFTFAGFNFPRYIPEFHRSKYDDHGGRRKTRIAYQTAPTPGEAGKGGSFYLNSDFQPGRSWRWCDAVDLSIRHTGWFTDGDCHDKIRGIVISLPHGRFLAGWSMGEEMASGYDGAIYTDELDAARAADFLAENVAEKEREYQEEERRKEEETEHNQGGDEEETEGY